MTQIDFTVDRVHPWSQRFDEKAKGHGQYLVRNEDGVAVKHFKGAGAKQQAEQFKIKQEAATKKAYKKEQPVYWVLNKENGVEKIIDRKDLIKWLGLKDFKLACQDLHETIELIRM